MRMPVSQERLRLRRAAFKAFDELWSAGLVRGDRVETAVTILERYVRPLEKEVAE